jgi:hypothetical protein
MEKTKTQKKSVADADINHVQKNKKAFAKTLKIHGHLQQATNLLARGLAKVSHGGYTHTINGKKAGPEGHIVSDGKNVDKIVDRAEFSKANFANGFDKSNKARNAVMQASKKLGDKV